MIKAVIFDIDGVLVDSRRANMMGFVNLFKSMGHKVPSEARIQAVFHKTLKDCIYDLGQNLTEKEKKALWRRSQTRLDYPWQLQKEPYGLAKTVKALAKQYTLAIVSSRIKKTIGLFFKKVPGLKKYFKVNVGFEDFTYPKPHPEPLLVASKKLRFKPEECVYVGDSQTDITSARRAGMKSIAFGKKLNGANLTVKKFTDLLSAVNKIDV